jgi:hypothetical protein
VEQQVNRRFKKGFTAWKHQSGQEVIDSRVVEWLTHFLTLARQFVSGNPAGRCWRTSLMMCARPLRSTAMSNGKIEKIVCDERMQFLEGSAAARAWTKKASIEDAERLLDLVNRDEAAEAAYSDRIFSGEGDPGEPRERPDEANAYHLFFGSEPRVTRSFASGFFSAVFGFLRDVREGRFIRQLEGAAEAVADDASDQELIGWASDIEKALAPWLARFENPWDTRIAGTLALVLLRFAKRDGISDQMLGEALLPDAYHIMETHGFD